ncbi:hypothetical protein DLJ53_20115 [Acuticoccus sediminis]|uniref:Uncharacterized protein n=1 Tax=Acuticoccus sediminis TaxID=2184697 RepID=A0A8B2NK84_9HYPH|nr:hypothetical protein [Acuticoccus sediminis]RAI00035.1 hypothetical protein DLJ53_20115 [Acuticoccus sediminis]
MSVIVDGGVFPSFSRVIGPDGGLPEVDDEVIVAFERALGPADPGSPAPAALQLSIGSEASTDGGIPVDDLVFSIDMLQGPAALMEGLG